LNVYLITKPRSSTKHTKMSLYNLIFVCFVALRDFVIGSPC